MNSEISKTSDPHRVLLNLSDTKIINLNYQFRLGMKNLNYLMAHILYQIFKFTLNISLKTVTDNLSIMVYVNKIENRITFKMKTGYYLELLTPETIKFLGITKSKINNNNENVPHLEITDIVLIHCNSVNNDYEQNLRVLYTFFPSKSFRQLLDISPKNFIFLKIFNSEFPYIEVWSTDENSKPIEIEHKINSSLVIN